MGLTVEQGAAGTVLKPDGRLDMVTAPAFRNRVKALVGSGQYRLIVDMSAVEFVDSSGLGALIFALKRAREEGGEMRIAAGRSQLLTVLQLTRLDRVLHPYTSVEAALAQP
jgi:anti-anti-sigma factor